MTTISTIMKDALRESNLIAIGVDPTDDEQEEALRLLNRFIASLFGNEIGEFLTAINYGTANVATSDQVQDYENMIQEFYAPLNVRMIMNLDAVANINLHPEPNDGSRLGILDLSGNMATNQVDLIGNGRTIEGSTFVTLNTNSLNREWFYRADLGDWKRITDLIGTDSSPFPQEYDDLLIIGLAMRLNPRNSIQADPQSVQAYTRLRRQFQARYRQSKETHAEWGLLHLNANRIYTNIYNVDDTFEKGLQPW